MSYKGFSKLERVLLEDLETARMGLLDLAIYALLGLRVNSTVGSTYICPPGVWFGSAKAIRAIAPRQAPSERAIQRSLVHLEKIGRIKRWVVKGKRGNYPIMVAQHPVADLSGKRYAVNAEATEDWRIPKLDPVDERFPVENCADAKSSTNKETRTKEETQVASSQLEPNVELAKRRQASEAGCQLADRLRQGILTNNPRARITERQMQRWAEDADRMIRDGRTRQEIAHLIAWCQHDRFWRSNILSMGKLREKFDQLTLKASQARSYEEATPSFEGVQHGTSKFSRLPRVQ